MTRQHRDNMLEIFKNLLFQINLKTKRVKRLQAMPNDTKNNNEMIELFVRLCMYVYMYPYHVRHTD